MIFCLHCQMRCCVEEPLQGMVSRRNLRLASHSASTPILTQVILYWLHIAVWRDAMQGVNCCVAVPHKPFSRRQRACQAVD
jgi:hypothetical protein